LHAVAIIEIVDMTKPNLIANPPACAISNVCLRGNEKYRLGLLHMLNKCLRVLVTILAITLPNTVRADLLDFFGVGDQSKRIVINAKKRRLLLIYGNGKVKRYPVAVPKSGKEWYGTTYVNGKYKNPDWSPPDVVAADHPGLPSLIPGGSSRNPMGARAITFRRDEVAIHGTSKRMRNSIGTAASYGCIRMRNEDVIDLYNRVSVGTPVQMVR
jgi:lipoprotein-anchoring transpeptidase ErfK/SrfK